MKRPTAKELAEKIREGKGNVSAVARAFHVPRSTVYGWIQSSEIAKQALADEREMVVDVAESVLFRKVLDQDMTAVAYVLNNAAEARSRGWGAMQYQREIKDVSKLSDDELHAIIKS